MRAFQECSGPWVGQSIQAGFRLTEKIELSIRGASFSGSGTDVDGEFALDGTFDEATGIVTIVRRYTLAPRNPSQVGYPFDYLGKWTGDYVSGRWMGRGDPDTSGPFEMWPVDRDEAETWNLSRIEETKTLTVGAT